MSTDSASRSPPLRDPVHGRVAHERNPVILRGSPYDDDAVDRVVAVDVPALSKALRPLGTTFDVSEATGQPEARPLGTDDRRAIIDQAILILNHLYVHRYMKRTRHAVDPVTALQQLKRRCDALPPFEFHLEILRVFKSLRDIHTAYILPRPYSDMVAFLPFLLGAYESGTDALASPGDDDHRPDEGAADPALRRCVMVTGMLADFEHPYFRPGAEVLTWNGQPVQEAIRRVGAEEQGSNIYAQFELGLRLMTVRWFGGSLPPTEFFVTIAYRDHEQSIREIRFPWRVMLDPGQGDRVASVQAMWELKEKYERQNADDPSLENRSLIEGTVRNKLFAVPSATAGPGVRRTPIVIDDVPDEIFETSIVSVRSGRQTFKFGLVRIESFVCGWKTFLPAFVKILNAMPSSGLVIDIRSNPGGMVSAAESILQTLTPQEITPLPFQFLATTLVEDVVTSSKSAARKKLRDWDAKVTPSINVGNLFSHFGTLTNPEDANSIGQRYYGPVALMTNAVTYSSGDIFAASFQDHEIGKVIGVDPTTGGGGANMWGHRDCVDMVEAGRELAFLPGGAVNGAKMHYAVRRCTRVHRNAGMAIEEEGVRGDELYELTRDDLLGGDIGLMRFAAGVLQRDGRPRYEARLFCDGKELDLSGLEIDVIAARHRVEIIAEITVDASLGPTEHVVHLDGVPRKTVRSRNGSARISMRFPADPQMTYEIRSHRVRQNVERAETFAMLKRRILFSRSAAQ